MPVTDNLTVMKYGGYLFKWSRKLEPIPVQVPDDIAEFLLQMMDRSCRCHWRPPKPMFAEVAASH